VAYLQRHPPNICIEIGRKSVPGAIRPGFAEIEQAINALKVQGTARQAA
jgi:chemotaxis protein MotA